MLIAVLTLGVTTTGWAKGGKKKKVKWLTSYTKALKLAKKHDKPILINFTGSDWCGWCIKLKKEVFNKKEFKAWARGDVVLLEIDFPNRKRQSRKLKKANAKLAKKYKVTGYPTIFIINADQEILGKSGYHKGGPKPWIANAQAFIDKDIAKKLELEKAKEKEEAEKAEKEDKPEKDQETTESEKTEETAESEKTE